jgi:hypothetical protein
MNRFSGHPGPGVDGPRVVLGGRRDSGPATGNVMQLVLSEDRCRRGGAQHAEGAGRAVRKKIRDGLES